MFKEMLADEHFLNIALLNPLLDFVHRRLLVAELILLVYLADLLLQTLWLFVADVRDEIKSSLAENVSPLLRNADLSPFLDGALRHLLLRLHLREEEHLLNECLACHEHHETVNADADT